ncbi:DUF222 domain-containing protein [Arthrobacter sp. Sa2BUA2]|uniref:DUF222 domain-containing protein n=1 Tax=Arthrobacter pullicola TaxID=2762224 RepID=A0ABR8YKU4_9MICC|nr:HNH endonuclease signature motif containing protein [Arthrobacter pullicola]MBD8044839.1 DUF222 domain-containing protein [Arthrobacter pullicola]
MTPTAPSEDRLFEAMSDACGSNSGRSNPCGSDTGSRPNSEGRLSCLDTFSASSTSNDASPFHGAVSLISPETLDPEEAGTVLARLAALASWAKAQQTRVVHRLEALIAEEVEGSLQQPDEGLAMSLTAAEAGAVLNIPHMSALQLVSDASQLCTDRTATLAALSHGHISHRHARAVLDQLQNIPRAQAPDFEAELLSAAEGRTCAQFTRTARRLRERRWPETISARHRTALDKRRVSFDPAADGMGEFCARIAAEKGQAIYTALTLAAQGERKAGDPRTLDQLRADIFTSLMLHSSGTPPAGDSWAPDSKQPAMPAPSSTGLSETGGFQPGEGWPGAGNSPADEGYPGTGSSPVVGRCPAAGESSTDGYLPGAAGFPNTITEWDDTAGIKAEIMVLISAETLFGDNEHCAELNGVGPISAEAGRRLARQALHWTGLVQDPSTGEILAVGRRRKIPAGLKRWLQARDGTCRFPGCGVSPARTEIDHTHPWASGGLTEHGNLAHLCPKHHRYKTLGFWRARQKEPGFLEWISPLGRIYQTSPQLHYGPNRQASGSCSPQSTATPSDSDPPPF